jgi:hypothetical protein
VQTGVTAFPLRRQRSGGDYFQPPAKVLESPDLLGYLLVLLSESTDLIMAGRSVGWLTSGLRIPISLFGNSTSSTAIARSAVG